jgi:threonyl-tRNA synthetase
MIPLSEKFLKDVEKMAEKIEKHHIRVDIDDRTLTLQKRVWEAETDWVPYIVVVGQKELESGVLPTRDRAMGKEPRNMKLEELISTIEVMIVDKPLKPLPVPKYLSKRPQFHG